MSTSGRIHSAFLRLLYFIADKQASDYFADLDYEPHKEEFCHRRAVSSSISTVAPLASRVLKLSRSVAPPTPRAATLLCLVPCHSVLLTTIGTSMTFTNVPVLELSCGSVVVFVSICLCVCVS